MQKVERRTHRNNKHRRSLWLAAAVLLLAGGIAAAVLLNRPEEKPTAAEDHSGLISDRKAEEVVSVTVERRDGESWTLIRDAEGNLRPEDGGDWTADTQTAALLEEAMAQLRYEEILTEDPEVYSESPADFGLENPRVTVTARYADGSSLTVHIGNDTGLEEGWSYMTAEGDGRLYAVSSGIADQLDVEYALLHPVARPEIYGALLDRITVSDGAGNVIARWELQGEITDRDAASNWAVTAPFTCPADEEAISNLKKSAEDLRLGTYTADAGAAEKSKYGLETPRRIVEFHMAKGSTGTVGDSGVYDVQDHGERTVELRIGDSPDGLADYVQYGDEIFTVSHFTLAAFADPDPMATAARYPVLTPLASLEGITIEENGRKLEYTLRDREKTVEGENPGRQVLLNGEEIPWEGFEAAYDRLLTVTFSGALPEGAEWKEAYKKYTFRTLSGGTHTVTLGDWDGVHDAVTVDGSTLFYLIRGGMTDLPGEDQ